MLSLQSSRLAALTEYAANKPGLLELKVTMGLDLQLY